MLTLLRSIVFHSNIQENSMPAYTQADRPLTIDTPLGPDVLLLQGFRGTAGISELFRFELDLLAVRGQAIPFDGILGRPVSVRGALADGGSRHFHGIVSRFIKVRTDESFIHFRAVLSPALWLGTRMVRSRVFQKRSIPDILAEVLAPLRPNLRFHLQTVYPPRDYCVQYDESDFAFVSRLMEEEGIFYFFEHSAEAHTLVVADGPGAHPELKAAGALVFRDGPANAPGDVRISDWQRAQEVCSGRYTLWDQNFELTGRQDRPFRNLEARVQIPERLPAEGGGHRLRLGVNDDLEVYEYPGGHARRYDGEGAAEKIYADGARMARVRLEETAARSLEIDGASNYGQMEPGSWFRLQGLPEENGEYVLTRVEHEASAGGFRSGEKPSLNYSNRFACIPAMLLYRPSRRTTKPRIDGVQTAVVVGMDKENVFCDKYGRVKVQFHWDREGKFDADSSCWVRVAQTWAGNRWGAFFWPRPGHEVVVAFENGDPDRPLITGSVYNAANMPPLELPRHSQTCGVKSASAGGNPLEQYNCVLFHDAPGNEHLHLHSHARESNTSGSSRMEYTPGPTLEVSGSGPIPTTGSGGGGGSPVADLRAHAGSFSIFDPIVFAIPYILPKDWSEAIASFLALFPGKTSFICGNNVNITLWGNRLTHITAGGEIKDVFDLEYVLPDLVKTGAGKALGFLWSKLGFRLPAMPPMAGAILGHAGNVLGLATTYRMPGDVAMVVGPKSALNYWGPKYDINRCKSYTYKEESFFGNTKNPYNLAAKSLAVLTTVAAVASDVLGRVFAVKAEGGVITTDDKAFVISNKVANTLQNYLLCFEQILAVAQTAKVDLEKTERESKQAADQIDFVTGVDSTIESIKDDLKLAKESLKDLIDTLADTTSKAIDEVKATRDSHVYQGNYQLKAKNVSLVSQTSTDSDETSAITIDAAGNALRNTGQLTLSASGSTHLTCGKSGVYITGKTGAFNIVNCSPGKIIISQGGQAALPRIILDTKIAPLIRIAVGLPSLGSAIEVGPKGMTLQFGPKGGPAITIDEKGIQMSYGPTSGITISPKGLTLNGPILNMEALLQSICKTMQEDSSTRVPSNNSNSLLIMSGS